MTRHLCITVTLLDPLFHGRADHGEPEWPPSPMRLFQALLAGARTGCRERRWQADPAKSEAFRWLESLPPPQIIAPQHMLTCGYTQFVPNNDGDEVWDRQQRLTGRTVQPYRVAIAQQGEADITQLHYLWPIDDKDDTAERHSTVIAEAARSLFAFGWGLDSAIADARLVRSTDITSITGNGDTFRSMIHWRPSRVFRSPDSQRRRSPRPNSLADLERVHKSLVESTCGGQYQPRHRLRIFETVSYVESTTVPPRPYAAFELCDFDGDFRTFPQQQVVVVAAMMRSLACREENRADFAQQFDTVDTDVFLAGHTSGTEKTPPRFSYLVLPTIGHKHTDGMIRRVLIAEPHGSSGTYARWASHRLGNAMLIDKAGRGQAYLAPAQSDDNVLKKYVGTATRWETVTPVILPGYDGVRSVKASDQRPTKAEKMLFKCMEQADIPLAAVKHVYMRKAPYWPGSFHPKCYHLPDYLKHPQPRPGWHVCLVFRQPFTGPLALGAGRHCGLGVFAAAH